jgi:hypothetical protein
MYILVVFSFVVFVKNLITCFNIYFQDKSYISQKVTRTPEKAFENVVESKGNLNYVYIEHGGQKLRVHYVDQGHRNGKVREILC